MPPPTGRDVDGGSILRVAVPYEWPLVASLHRGTLQVTRCLPLHTLCLSSGANAELSVVRVINVDAAAAEYTDLAMLDGQDVDQPEETLSC